MSFGICGVAAAPDIPYSTILVLELLSSGGGPKGFFGATPLPMLDISVFYFKLLVHAVIESHAKKKKLKNNSNLENSPL